MHFLSSFRSFRTRNYNNVSWWNSSQIHLLCPLPLARLLKVLNVACGKSGKSGKMVRGSSNLRLSNREQAYETMRTSIRGNANKQSFSHECASADNWTGQASSFLLKFDFRTYIFHDLAKNMQAYLCILSSFYCKSVQKKRLHCSKICIFALFVVYSHPNLG